VPYKWTPPPGYATFELNGKVYQPGDMVPISKASAEHHMKFGHVFEGIDAPETPAPAMIPAQPSGKAAAE
jgi:hypothetical protein